MSKVTSARRNSKLNNDTDVDDPDNSFVKDFTQRKRPLKKMKDEDEDLSELIGMYQAPKKKAKDVCTVSHEETKKKFLDGMEHQIEARKKASSDILKSLPEIITQLEAEQDVLTANEQKLDHVTGIILKCVKQANMAQKENLKSLKEVYENLKKQCEDMYKSQKVESLKLANVIEEDMQNLQKKLVTETKKKQLDKFKKTFLQMNEF